MTSKLTAPASRGLGSGAPANQTAVDTDGTKSPPPTNTGLSPERKRSSTSNTIAQGLASLIVQLPDRALAKVAAEYDGLTPIERFMEETCGIKNNESKS